MKKASITEAKNNLSALIGGLKSGAPVLILDRGRPVARLEPVITPADPHGRLSRLTREGLMRPARASLDRKLLSGRLPHAKRGGSALAALLQERRESR
jgi:antitoxin (DNA-binding transcriptional repressor) of toxin-antitoxin stability system